MVIVVFFFFLMIRLPPRATRTDTLFPYTSLFRSCFSVAYAEQDQRREFDQVAAAQLAPWQGTDIVAAVGTRGCRERPQCRQAKRSRVYQVLRCPACVGGGSCRDFHGRCFPGMWRGTSTRLHFHQRRISRSAAHTSELQSLMRISYAVFCLQKIKHHK